jgi:hypothetical protein
MPNPTAPKPSPSLAMLVSTPHGDAYTYLKLDGMLRNAGFLRNELRSLSPGGQRVIISHKMTQDTLPDDKQ